MVSGGSAPATSLLTQSGARTRYDERQGCFALAELPEGVHAAGEVVGAGELGEAERSGTLAGAEAAHELGFGDESLARTRRRRRRGLVVRRGRARDRRAAGGDELAARQVLRLPLRGRDREGHPPERGGGLRLDRALEALHDHDDGAMPGPHVPAARGAADGRGDRAEPGRGGHHHLQAALARRADGRAGRTPVRARQALVDARPPPGARGERPVGGRLATRVRLRRRARRGARGARGRRTDRRIHARQADRARARRRRVPRPALPEPLLEPEAWPHPLRRDRQRRRADHGRRHDLPPGRRQLLRDHHLERRRRGVRVVLLVAGRLAPARAPHRRHPGPLGGQPRRAARAGDPRPRSPSSTARPRASRTWTGSAPRWPGCPA